MNINYMWDYNSKLQTIIIYFMSKITLCHMHKTDKRTGHNNCQVPSVLISQNFIYAVTQGIFNDLDRIRVLRFGIFETKSKPILSTGCCQRDALRSYCMTNNQFIDQIKFYVFKHAKQMLLPNYTSTVAWNRTIVLCSVCSQNF